MTDTVIRKLKVSDLNSINKISQGLHPEWFTEEALENIPRDIQFSKCLVAEKKGRVVGFVSVFSHDGKPMIGWLGIDKKMRGKKIGKLLIERAEIELESLGYKDLRVETVGECTPLYEPYVQTLKFYESMGFRVEKRGRLRIDLGYKWRLSTLKKKLGTKRKQKSI